MNERKERPDRPENVRQAVERFGALHGISKPYVTSAFAKACGVSRQAVFYWMQDNVVPVERVELVCMLTGARAADLNPVLRSLLSNPTRPA